MMMDRKKLAIGAVAVAVLALGGGVAIAAQQPEEPKIDRGAAEKAALGDVPGEVKETELENEGGSAVYEVEVLGEDGKLHEVAVDAGNGQVLGQETEDNGFDDQGSDDQGSDDQGSEDAD
jgi:uncharacterized membrane protein YkoI